MRPTIRVLQALANNARRKETTSFIGLGRMGYEMANNLFSKTYKASQDTQFVVCDALPETAHAFREAFIKKHPGSSVTVADDPHQAALASSTIITMLPSSPQVEEVYSRIVPALSSLPKSQKAETLCIDSTTLDVEVARKVASDVTGLGSRMVDAPVSGGVSGAHAGTLAFLVGGPKDSFELARPILTLMGQRIIHCGDSGAGLGAKICNNLVLGVEQIVIAEAMLLGGKLGLDPAILASVINSSTGSCWSCSVNNPVPSALPGKTPPCEKDYEGGFATALMLKACCPYSWTRPHADVFAAQDMGLAAEIAAKQKSALPLGLAARDLYSKVVSEEPSLARKDFSSVYKFLEKK